MAKYLKDFRQGDTKKIRIKYANDITGWKFRITMLPKLGDPASLVVETTAGDHTDDSPTEGLAYLEITSTDSASLDPANYLYFLQRIITGSPDDILTILPPIKDATDKLKVVDGAG
jgi:hypothetical protein